MNTLTPSLAPSGTSSVAPDDAEFVTSAHPVYDLDAAAPRLLEVLVQKRDHVVLADDYYGGHGAIAWAMATLSGAALGPLAERAYRSLTARRRGRVAVAAGAVTLALGLFLPPSNRVRAELFRNPCSLSWALAATVWRAPKLRTPEPAPPASLAPWLADRSSLPSIRSSLRGAVNWKSPTPSPK